jgi:ATP-binding cassette subfamily B protein
VALLLALARGRYGRLSLTVLLTALTVLFQFLNPQVIRATVDSVIGEEPFDLPVFALGLVNTLGGRDGLRAALWIPALIFIGIGLCQGLANLWRRYFIPESAEYISQRLRNTLFGHIQTLPYEWHVKIQTGDIIQRCTSDVDTLKNFMANQLGEIARSVLLVIIALSLMFPMDTLMTLAALSLMPVIFAFSWRFSKSVSKRFLKADEAEGALQACAQENLTGVRVVRAFGRERFEVKRFKEKNDAWASQIGHLANLLGNFWGLGDVITGVQIGVVVVVGVLRCQSGALTLGTFLAFYSYIGLLIWPVRNLGRLLSDMSKAGVALGRVREILSAAPETDAPDDLEPDIKGDIAFEHVTFAYGDQPPVLKDISFTLRPGRTLAILGATGSGKSSLVHLLCRLYDLSADGGRITIDGTDIRHIKRGWLRNHVGLVLQEPFLFSKTIRENISVTTPDAEPEAVHGAARVASLHESVEEFANGYETLIGERGVTLSGGQRQRVAIARMLMREAPIMIFDDSLSAVDTETDARIRRALRGRTKAAATIIISHRLSTLMQADEILVLRDGRIEEMGSHEELLALNGSYRRIFDMQGRLEEESAQ